MGSPDRDCPFYKNGFFVIKQIVKNRKGKKVNLQLIKLSPDSKDRKFFEQINEEAFPLSERISFDEFFAFAAKTGADILGIYDGMAPVGFFVLLKNTECGYVFFFAIDKSRRSSGYGSAAMKKLIDTYSEQQIILDFEILDENAENYAQRIRRKGFYLRNGFHETGNYTILRGDKFEVVCTGGELNRPAFKELIHILHASFEEFPDMLI